MVSSQEFNLRNPTLMMALLALCAWAGLVQPVMAIEPGQYYRYVNEEGVKVISHSIPPKYAQRGYEVINRAGLVLRVVEAAPDPEDVAAEKARRAKHRALLAQYEVLARRYSNVDEIYAARDRRLTHIDANIAILKSNINSLDNQIDDLMSKAAGFERSGRKVPAVVLNNLEETRLEKRTAEDKLKNREAEYDEIYESFEQNAKLYLRGKKLEAELAANGQLDLSEPGPPPEEKRRR